MKVILICIGVLFALLADAQNYRVASRNTLNVRSGAGVGYDVIGTLNSKDTVHVIELKNHWAKINYQEKEAYVSSKYILPIKSNQKKTAKEFFQGIGALFSEGPISYLPFLIITILLTTLLLYKLFAGLYTTKLIIGNIGLIAICVMEFVYFIGYSGQPWFCYPDNVGWVWAIINFLLYGFVLLRQVSWGLEIIGETCHGESPNLEVGIYSYGVVFILGIIFSLAKVDMLEYLFYGFIVAQIAQIIINYRSIRNFWKATMVSFLFLLVCSAVIVSAIYFIAMLIAMFIAITVACFILDVAAAGLKNNHVTEEIHHYH